VFEKQDCSVVQVVRQYQCYLWEAIKDQTLEDVHLGHVALFSCKVTIFKFAIIDDMPADFEEHILVLGQLQELGFRPQSNR
jgi:hypothetical protein